MATDDARPDGPPDRRETYEEYSLGSERVALIADPENEHAWVQSDVTTPVER